MKKVLKSTLFPIPVSSIEGRNLYLFFGKYFYGKWQGILFREGGFENSVMVASKL